MNSQNVAVWDEPHQHTARAERPKTQVCDETGNGFSQRASERLKRQLRGFYG